ncbi:MAG: hypothetical protein JWO74_2406 [Solirubrobacterales bacterium]|nr:hypothetical protein [Solirubrobacterales bacterium]
MDAPLRTLVIASTPADAGEVTRALISAGIPVGSRRIETTDDLARVLSEADVEWDLILCAPGGGLDERDVVARVRSADREVPVVVFSRDPAGLTDAATGVLALSPDQPAEEIGVGVRRELDLADTRRAARQATAALHLRDHALASAGNGIVIGDASQHGFPIVYVNPAWERLTGWEARQILGQSCAILQGPDTDPDVVAQISEALREGRGCQVTIRNYRRDGRPFWNDLTLSPVRDDAGAITHVVGVVDDATERVEARDRLRAVRADNERLLEGLAEAETRYRELVEQIPAVTYVADFDELGTMRYVSPQIEALLGHPAAAFVEDPHLWTRVVHPGDRDRVVAETARVFREQVEFDCEFRMISADGRELYVWERDNIVRDEAGVPQFTQGVLLDITSLRTAESALRDERDRAQTYLDVAGTLIVVLDPEARVVLLNRTGHELLGYRDGDLVGRDWFETCIPAEEREEVRDAFTRLMRGELTAAVEAVENRVLTRNGTTRTIAWHNTLLQGDGGAVNATLSSGVDVTDRRRAEEQVVHLAYHDSLTDLPNRALLQEHLELALARARRNEQSVALLYLDLDDFKLVNDSFGHAAGDELLHQLATRLRRRRRASDLLARHGGDEFLLLIADIERDPSHVAVAAAEGLLSAVSEPFELRGAEFHLGASIGISIYPADASDADTLLRHADQAMYQAKSAGRAGVRHYVAADEAKPIERLSMTTRLRRAIVDDEFVLHWQPIMSPVDGSLYALEALIRWEDPQRGRIPPVEFIGVAEETGLIDRLGEWVAEAVCRQRLAWQADGLDPVVTLNVSPRELRRPDFAERLLERIARHGLDPSRMIAEITETAAMSQSVRTEPLMGELAAGGIRVAIDDFGAGYSSLSRLRELPVHILKVERQFLAEVPEREDASAVITAILDLGTALGMDVVVEGIETEEQRSFLVERGCRLAQGFLLARPVPAGELRPLLEGARAPV